MLEWVLFETGPFAHETDAARRPSRSGRDLIDGSHDVTFQHTHGMEKPSVMESWANDALCCANDAGLDAEVGGIKPAANSGRDLLAVLNRRTAEAAEIDPEAPLEEVFIFLCDPV